jgi:FtsP/CotA-like multicopper oxidase with cupredoxin domain
MVQEWYSHTARHRFYQDKEEAPTSILVNGVGRYHHSTTVQPWQVFTVQPAECSVYRFRLVSSVSLHCPVQFSIEEHNFTVIATDGEYIQPEENVSSLTISNGERYDILVDVSQHEEKAYVMRFGGAPGEFANCRDLSSIAFLQYGQAVVDQSLEPDYAESILVPGRHVNPLPTVSLPQDQDPVPVSELHSSHIMEHQGPADRTFYLQLGDGAGGANINNILFDLNTLTTPLLTQEWPDQGRVCDQAYSEEGLLCDPALDLLSCECQHILYVETGDLVEIFLINPDLERPIAHPVHLHGYFFNVIGSGYIPQETPMAYLRQQNEEGNIERNLINPPRKDSIQTAPGGYLLIRFFADNPGYWLMHCHISFDVIEGQVLVMSVGNRDEWTIPEDFPECGVQ